MFKDIFTRKTFCDDKLNAYGFVKTNGGFKFEKDILNGEFRLTVHVRPKDSVDTVLTDTQSKEEYILYKTGATGEFVGKIRENIRGVLQNIAENCCETAVFQSPQIAEFLKYTRLKYGGAPEFLWKDTPQNAVLRRKDNQKWYAVLLTVSGKKLGLAFDDDVEILNLKGKPEQIESLINGKNYFPAWHMNKKHWYSVLLNGKIPTQDIRAHTDESYSLAK